MKLRKEMNFPNQYRLKITGRPLGHIHFSLDYRENNLQ